MKKAQMFHRALKEGKKAPSFVKNIFDDSEAGAKDPNRVQIDLTAADNTSKLIADRVGTAGDVTTIKHIIKQLKTMFPEHDANDMSVLFSIAGGNIQAAHADYPTDKFRNNNNYDTIPLGVLVGLQDDTVIDLWPGAIEGGKDCEDVDPIRLHYNAGDIVIFRGDLTHAGAPFDHNNVRLHMYLDNPSVTRPKDHTEKHNNCTVRRNLKHKHIRL